MEFVRFHILYKSTNYSTPALRVQFRRLTLIWLLSAQFLSLLDFLKEKKFFFGKKNSKNFPHGKLTISQNYFPVIANCKVVCFGLLKAGSTVNAVQTHRIFWRITLSCGRRLRLWSVARVAGLQTAMQFDCKKCYTHCYTSFFSSKISREERKGTRYGFWKKKISFFSPKVSIVPIGGEWQKFTVISVWIAAHLRDARVLAVGVTIEFTFVAVVLNFSGCFSQIFVNLLSVDGISFHGGLSGARTCKRKIGRWRAATKGFSFFFFLTRLMLKTIGSSLLRAQYWTWTYTRKRWRWAVCTCNWLFAV